MQLCNVKDLNKFFAAVNDCSGKVELVSEEGDHLNLKSTLSKFVAFAKLIEGDIIPKMEIIAYEDEDKERLIRFMMDGE